MYRSSFFGECGCFGRFFNNQSLHFQSLTLMADSSFSCSGSGMREKKSRPVAASTASTVTAKSCNGRLLPAFGRMKAIIFSGGVKVVDDLVPVRGPQKDGRQDRKVPSDMSFCVLYFNWRYSWEHNRHLRHKMPTIFQVFSSNLLFNDLHRWVTFSTSRSRY